MPEDENLLEQIKKLYIAIIILFAGIFGSYVLIAQKILPARTQINELQASILEQSSKYNQNKAKYEELKKSMQKQEEETAPEKLVYIPAEKGLPAEDVLSGEFAEILEIIRGNSIKVRSLSFDYNPRKDKFLSQASEMFNVWKMTMNTVATYKNFENFLKDLYKHEHFLDIDTIKVTPYEKDKSILIIDFTMKMYAQK